jgi:SPP1 family predicted phage head-tail adaptor
MLLSRLNNRVSFWQKEKGRNPDGSVSEKWKEKFSAWAEVISIGGEEGRLAAADSSSIKYRLTMRYRRDLDPSMMVKILDEGRFLAVQVIRDPDGRKNIVELACSWKQGQIEPS